MVNLSRSARPKCSAIAAFGLALLMASPIPAFAQPAIGDIVTFGDSLSDPGNGFVFIRESATPPDFSTNELLFPSAPYARGGHHLSNGPTWIEQLAQPLGLSRSVNPAFKGSNPFAMNFAVGTARARNDFTNPSLSLLVSAFLQKTGGVARADALYVIQIGANDVRDALAAVVDEEEPLPILQAAAAAIAANVSTLHAAGARQFLIWNVPDIGLTPALAIADTQFPGEIPSPSAVATFLTERFNALLGLALAPVAMLPGIALVPFDAFKLVTEIVENPNEFGLTNVTDACITPGVPPFTCKRPDTFLFWDGSHPTKAAHGIIAGAVAQLLGF